LSVALSQAFLSQCTAALRQAFPEWAECEAARASRSPACLVARHVE
jgi:hypothetical protein